MPKYKNRRFVEKGRRMQLWRQRQQRQVEIVSTIPGPNDSLVEDNVIQPTTQEQIASVFKKNPMDPACNKLTPSVHDDLEVETDEAVYLTTIGEQQLSYEAEELIVEPEHQDKHINAPTGRRLIDPMKFYEKIKIIGSHGALGCGIESVDLISEKQTGFASKFTFKCRMCNMLFFVNNNDASMDINNSAVAGTIAIGCGLYQLQELCAALDLPPISQAVFQKHQTTVASNWEKAATESMFEAAEEEKRLAIEEGRVNKDGIPVIDVIADGCWSKRSYKKNYSALSGAAAIIGRRTGKILFLGVKNIYCSICNQAERKKKDPKLHECYRNFQGPSTSMESTILVEGFKASLEDYGIIYGRIISDGDSSTYHKILEARPYSDITVEKVECRNHILRNLCNKLQSLQTDTKYPVTLRKLITKKVILSIRGAIRKAITHNMTEEKDDLFHKTQLLFEDILQAHSHAFGNHTNCKTYFCKSGLQSNDNVPRDFYTSSLWQRICLIMGTVAGHARSLIHNVDSNVVECFHSVVAKFVGGKRINFSLRRGYQTRCAAAAVSFNTGKVLSNIHKAISKKSPTGGILKLEERKAKRKALMQKFNYKKRRTPLAPCPLDKNYGEASVKPDVPENMLEAMKTSFLATLKKSDQERNEIQEKTVLQGNCSEWLELRRSLLTASNFGRIIKRKPDTSCSNIVKELLYKASIDHVEAITHGKENEKLALSQLAAQENVEIRPCGLFIDPDLPFLGATPDGLTGDESIIEVKCPITAFKMGLQEAIDKRKVNFWAKDRQGNLTVNMKHNWYYQVQGQLHVARKKMCLFGVWFSDKQPLKTEIIYRDDDFFNSKMKDKLVTFYQDCILPELVDPRHTRNLPIRNPPSILEAIDKKRSKENKKPGMPATTV